MVSRARGRRAARSQRLAELIVLLQDMTLQRVEQAGPALNATVAKAKLHGLIVDRKESGAPGDFAALSTEAEVFDAVRAALGDAVADALIAALPQPSGGPANDPPEPEQSEVVERRDPNTSLN
jgi:hypothetical protein